MTILALLFPLLIAAPAQARPHNRPAARPAAKRTAVAKPAPKPVARPKPAPIQDRKALLTDRRQAPLPPADETGRPIAAAVAKTAPGARLAVMSSPGFAASITLSQRAETRVNHYYWHNDGGAHYCHYWDGSYHWYGFYWGGSFYWTRYHYRRWWWYDPFYFRWVYWSNQTWWWQDPADPGAIYVYRNGGYVPYYAHPAPAPAAPPPSDVDRPVYRAPRRPDSYAVVIGVENYPSASKADFAVRDARAVAAHLRALGYPSDHVVVLADRQASLSSVRNYLETWLPRQTDDGSRVFVYFAGQGAADPQTGQAYLLPYDADRASVPSTGYPIKRLYSQLNALPARDVVVALDTCFSGLGGRCEPVSRTPPARVDEARRQAGRVVVLSASAADEMTGAAPGRQHGLFTYFLLRGLNGAAHATPAGLGVQDLFDYVAPQVQDAARRANRDQDPEITVPPGGERGLLLKDLR